jgi:pyruvate/2-oxoglutarate/acetoin dehydrogenase E1 component
MEIGSCQLARRISNAAERIFQSLLMGAMVHLALEAATTLANDGIDVEVCRLAESYAFGQGSNP